LGDFVIRFFLYGDDLILIAKSTLGLQEHLISLEKFCSTDGILQKLKTILQTIFTKALKDKIQKLREMLDLKEKNVIKIVGHY
jgi:hypothetical protein